MRDGKRFDSRWVLKCGSRWTDIVCMRTRAHSESSSTLVTMRRAVAAALIALTLVVASGCVTQDPPGSEFVEDVQTDFEQGDYFNP
jgi:hypothetical protein